MFLAIKHYLNPVGQPELNSESEIISAKIDLPGLKNVFICSFYKPKENEVVGKSPSRTVPDRTYDCDRSWSPENHDFRYRLLKPHKK